MLSTRSCCCAAIHLLLLLHTLTVALSIQIPVAQSSAYRTPSRHVIVVGGGVGGLATASRIAALSKGNVKVTILEKNANVGGRCGSFYVQTSQGKFRHERGPSLLLLPKVYEELFLDCGATAAQFGLEMRPCVPAYQVVFDNGARVNLGFTRKKSSENSTITEISEAEAISRRILDSFEPNGSKKWDYYMRACGAYLDCGLPNFIEEKLDVSTFPAFLKESLRDGGKAWPLKPHSDVLDEIFQSDKMRALASFQDLYVGLEPYRNDKLFGGGVMTTTAPAVFGLLAAIELHPTNRNSGVFAPKGGFQAVIESFNNLALSLGVSILCNRTVTQITSNGAYSCTSDSKNEMFMPADLIIVNADLPYATKVLFPSADQEGQNEVAFKYDKYDWDEKDMNKIDYIFGRGVIAFHWSIEGNVLIDLNTHNVFLAAGSRTDAEKSWKVERDPALGVEPFNFYVHRASKSDETVAPKNCDVIMVLVPVEPLNRKAECEMMSRHDTIEMYKKQFSKQRIDKLREAVLLRLSAIDSLRNLRSHLANEIIETPATFADKYNLAAGSPFALSHGLSQLSVMRPGMLLRQNKNSLFVGASSRPGNGVPLVLIGAKKVAELAIKRLHLQ